MEFALTKLAYVTVRLLQEIPVIRLTLNERVQVIGTEQETVTLVISNKAGCKFELQRNKYVEP